MPRGPGVERVAKGPIAALEAQRHERLATSTMASLTACVAVQAL